MAQNGLHWIFTNDFFETITIKDKKVLHFWTVSISFKLSYFLYDNNSKWRMYKVHFFLRFNFVQNIKLNMDWSFLSKGWKKIPKYIHLYRSWSLWSSGKGIIVNTINIYLSIKKIFQHPIIVLFTLSIFRVSRRII